MELTNVVFFKFYFSWESFGFLFYGDTLLLDLFLFLLFIWFLEKENYVHAWEKDQNMFKLQAVSWMKSWNMVYWGGWHLPHHSVQYCFLNIKERLPLGICILICLPWSPSFNIILTKTVPCFDAKDTTFSDSFVPRWSYIWNFKRSCGKALLLQKITKLTVGLPCLWIWVLKGKHRCGFKSHLLPKLQNVILKVVGVWKNLTKLYDAKLWCFTNDISTKP